MSWHQIPDGNGSMTIRSSSSRSTGGWPSMPVSAAQNAEVQLMELKGNRRQLTITPAEPRLDPQSSRWLEAVPGLVPQVVAAITPRRDSDAVQGLGLIDEGGDGGGLCAVRMASCSYRLQAHRG
jgi:hypothetical protein